MDNTEANISKYSDEELMALVMERNTKALKILYGRYCKSIFNFVLRYTNNREISEDILQETFTRLWFSAHTFSPRKGTFKTWLFTIGINLTRDEMTKKAYSYQYVGTDELIGDDGMPGMYEPAVKFFEHEELKDTIAKALERLSPFLKEVIILKHYHELKFSEISEITSTPEGTLKARFHTVLKQLKRILQTAEF
jgi:RNA polymerase sigma-70 factor (ECF subfamily)